MADRELHSNYQKNCSKEKMFIEQLFKDELTESIEIMKSTSVY